MSERISSFYGASIAGLFRGLTRTKFKREYGWLRAEDLSRSPHKFPLFES
jgi:hypothetical protein